MWMLINHTTRAKLEKARLKTRTKLPFHDSNLWHFQVRPSVGCVGNCPVGFGRRFTPAERQIDAQGHRAKRHSAEPERRTFLPAQISHGKHPALLPGLGDSQFN